MPSTARLPHTLLKLPASHRLQSQPIAAPSSFTEHVTGVVSSHTTTPSQRFSLRCVRVFWRLQFTLSNFCFDCPAALHHTLHRTNEATEPQFAC